MPYLIGVLLAVSVSLLARVLRWDRDRGFYPFVLGVIAPIYVLFAVMGGSVPALIREAMIMTGFLVVAAVGFKTNLWVAAAGLFVHGVMDFFHARLVDNPGVPTFWPALCLSYDVVAAIILGWLLVRTSSGVAPRPALNPVAKAPLPHRRNIAWIVALSFAATILLALVLALVVVPGAAENVIAAVVLFALATGATLLSMLSARWSDQPQRWALRAAGGLALAGTLLLLWPDVVTTAAFAWGAPLLLLALVGWTTLRVRRDLDSRVRAWLVYPVLSVSAFAAVAGGYEALQEPLDRRANPMSGQLVDVGEGRRMYLSCMGSGSPLVVLVPGAGEPSSVWGLIAPEVALDTRVCVYDRAGRGWSDAAAEVQDGDAIAADLRALLTNADEAGPYVVVGHSFGGLYARSFAARYPDQTAGMVLLDASDPGMFTRLPTYPFFYEADRRVSALFPSLARVGVGRLVYGSDYQSLPRGSASQQRMFWFTARQARSFRDEWAAAPRAMQQADTLVTLGGRPLMVVTALQGAQQGWEVLQQEQASLSTNSSHWSLPNATHSSLVLEAANAAVSSRAIREVVNAVRTSQRLAGHWLALADVESESGVHLQPFERLP
jgi:pimeloyl-ACP methyl ester carboxylesterase